MHLSYRSQNKKFFSVNYKLFSYNDWNLKKSALSLRKLQLKLLLQWQQVMKTLPRVDRVMFKKVNMVFCQLDSENVAVVCLRLKLISAWLQSKVYHCMPTKIFFSFLFIQVFNQTQIDAIIDARNEAATNEIKQIKKRTNETLAKLVNFSKSNSIYPCF